MAKATNSYEMVKWISFDREKPASGEEIIVFSEFLGVLDAEIMGGELSAFSSTGAHIAGHFSHWAKPLKGPSTTQLWIDWAVSWVK